MTNSFFIKTQTPLISILCFLILLLSACTSNKYLKTAKSYFNASTVENKSKYMAPDYRSYFLEKAGEGNDKQSALQSFQQWDGPLHPDIKILQSHFKGNEGTIRINEQNDFAKLIGFPGWKATTHVTFDPEGLISEIVYVPDSTNADYKQWLAPAVDWLQKNMPDELNRIYRNGKLVQNENSAKEWVELLKKYNQQKKS